MKFIMNGKGLGKKTKLGVGSGKQGGKITKSWERTFVVKFTRSGKQEEKTRGVSTLPILEA
jgi:hypothetical protein